VAEDAAREGARVRRPRQRDPGNAEALAGLDEITGRYLGWVEDSLEAGRLERARTYLERARRVSPEAPRIAELADRLAEAGEAAQGGQGEAASATDDEVQVREIPADGLNPALVELPGGCFQMGSPQGERGRDDDDERRHRVCVEAFRMGRYEVTFDEYDRFARATGRDRPGDQGWGRGRRPVIDVSWHDAMAYADWLSKRTGRAYSLPTEAEWAYAARAGTQTARFWGEAAEEACSYANVYDRTSERVNDFSWSAHGCDDGEAHTAPVGSYEANPWGLYDVVGNVWEWTCSVYDASYGGAERRCGQGGDGARRALRGGSWYDEPRDARSAFRIWNTPTFRLDLIGFRLAQDL